MVLALVRLTPFFCTMRSFDVNLVCWLTFPSVHGRHEGHPGVKKYAPNKAFKKFCASGFRPSPKKTRVPNFFTGPSKIFLQFLVFAVG